MQINKRIDLIKLLPPKAVGCEIGVAEGNFSAELLESGLGVLYSVDAWKKIDGVTGDGNSEQAWHDKNFLMTTERLREFGERSIILHGMSDRMANRVADDSLDFLYHDGGHYFSAVLDDLRAWYPKVKSGGVVGFHDFLCPDYDVQKAAAFFLNELGGTIQLIIIPETHINDAGAYFIKP